MISRAFGAGGENSEQQHVVGKIYAPAANANNLVAKGTKRAPLTNIVNAASKKQAVEKAEAAVAKPVVKTSLLGRRVATKSAIPVKVEQQENVEPLPMDIQEEGLESSAVTVPTLSHFLRPIPAGVIPIDEADKEDPQQAAEYVQEIYGYMRNLEVKFQVSQEYLQRPLDFISRTRSILVNWLVEIHARFELQQETLFLSINVMDRYLALQEVPRNQLQLVGITALLIASKYEDMWPPTIKELIFMTEDAYTSAEILKMELTMLDKLGYALGQPLPLHFLRRGTKAGQGDWLSHGISKYLIELCLMDHELLKYVPSEVAAASLHVARTVLKQEDWTTTLEFFTGYEKADLMPCVAEVQRVLKLSVESKHQAIRSKWSKRKHLEIAVNAELTAYIRTL